MQTFKQYLQELKLTLEYHKDLNPKLWDEEGKLKNEIRVKLLDFGYTWAKFAKIPRELIQDVIMTGGNANYNYTQYSDIDVHLMIDKSKLNIATTPEMTEEWLKNKKFLWLLTHKVKVMGYDLEPYAQEFTDKYPEEQGIYSLLNNKWLQNPEYKEHKFQNDPQLVRKIEFYMHMIDNMIKNKSDLKSFTELKTKFKDMRSAGIQKGGEYSFENLIFKELRNRGYLDKMNDYSTSYKDKQLGVE